MTPSLTGSELPRRMLRRYWPLLAVAVPCLFLALGGEPVREALRYDRTMIFAGQLWRLVTGNFVHFGWGHLAEDMAGLVLLWLLFEDALPGWRSPAVILAGSLAVGLGLLIGNPGLGWYVGISGALDTLWAVGALELIRQRDRFGWILVCLLLTKLGYEQFFGPLPFSSVTTAGTVTVDAHLYGALAGALIGFGGGLPWGRIIPRSMKGEG